MTILATGFTMDDIPLIADKRRTEAAQMTEEELRLEEERIEKERKERDLIGNIMVLPHKRRVVLPLVRKR